MTSDLADTLGSLLEPRNVNSELPTSPLLAPVNPANYARMRDSGALVDHASVLCEAHDGRAVADCCDEPYLPLSSLAT